MRTQPWSPLGAARAFGSGEPRIQLVRLPSFSRPAFWEICEVGSEWVLYSATVVDPGWSTLTVRGYELAEFDGNKLRTYFERLAALTLPVAPDPRRNLLGADGTVTQLALFGGLWSQVRYQWWSEHPPGWTPMVQIAEEMFAAFGGPAEAE